MLNRSLSLSRQLAVALAFGAASLFGGLAHAQAPAAPAGSTTTQVPVAADTTTPAAAPAAVAAPAMPGAAAAKPASSDENPYGIAALWKGSDAIAKAVLLILVIMSAGSWYIMVVKWLEQSRIGRQGSTMDKNFWQAGSVREAAAKLEKNSPYRYIAETGADAVSNHNGLKRHIPMNEWVPMSIQGAVDVVQAKTQGGLAFLATVGSTSPFVGLFGTVWGIYHALTAIGLSGQASIDKVAGPVGEALIMTAIGLAVAIPAVFGYNWLAKKNKAVMDDVREFSDELNAVILGSAGKAA